MKRAWILLPLLTLLPVLGRAATFNNVLTARTVMEAENASLAGVTTFNNVTWAAFSNNKAVGFMSAGSGTITFSFTPPVSANYVFEFQVMLSGGARWLNAGVSGVNDTNGTGMANWKIPNNSGLQLVYMYAGGGSGTTTNTSARSFALTAGNAYSIVLKGVDAGMIIDYMIPFLDPSTLPAATPTPGTGLCASYWNWTGASPPTVPGTTGTWTGLQGPINWGNLGGGWPPTGIGTTLFDAEWDGFVQPNYTDTYTFTTVSDDGVKLWINGVQLVNDWNDHGPTTDTGSITLNGGTKYSVKLQYYQNGGGAQMQMQWWAPGLFTAQSNAPQAVPLAQLYPCGAGGGTPTKTATASPTFTASPSPTPAGSNPPPVLVALSPTSGADNTFATGVTLTGLNFLAGSTVSFGGSAGTGVAYINPTTIWCMPPIPHAAGVVLVTVTTTNGTSNSLSFTYVDPVWQGLTPDTRLYGLEYIPFPVQASGANHFYDLSQSFTSAASNDVPKNTARWKIVLTGLASVANVNCKNCLQIETRVGPDGVTCTSGYISQDTVTTTAMVLPSKPQNMSIDYTWLLAANVPVTQAFDAMGDPRYVPYLDLMSTSAGPFANNYNWFFRNLAGGSADASGTSYKPFIADATFNSYSGGQGNVDVPKLYRLIREGVMLTTSVYTAVDGWSNYYFGVGGEIGGDSSNDLPAPGVVCDGAPWNQTGTYKVDEIIGSQTNGASWVRSTNGWFSRPYIGELWPDALYQSDWSGHAANTSWGNLKNAQHSGVAYRDSITNFDATYPVTYTAGGVAFSGTYGASAGNTYNFGVIYHRDSAMGCATMMNGTDGSSANTFNHSSPSYTANLLYDGTIINNDFNFPMPATFAVSRPWQLNLGGNTPDEWSTAPYNGRRTTLSIYSASAAANGSLANQPASQLGFYDWTNGTEARTSAAVRLVDTAGVVNPGVTTGGIFVINGLAPSGTSGINFVARFALLACVRTFLDAGTPTTNGNVSNQIGANGPVLRTHPVPLIQITSPTNHQDRSHINPLTIDWKERYARWDDNRYTENYPCLNTVSQQSPCAPNAGATEDPTQEWHDTTTLFFNVIYSADDAHWYSAQTNTPAIPGEPVNGATSGPDVVPYSSTHLYAYTWNISAIAPANPSGNKFVRVECFRLDPSGNLMQHYSYHEIQVITAP